MFNALLKELVFYVQNIVARKYALALENIRELWRPSKVTSRFTAAAFHYANEHIIPEPAIISIAST